jgi:hypothetical protein
MKKFLYAWIAFGLVVWIVATFASAAVCRLFLAGLGGAISAACLWLLLNQKSK